MKYCSFLRRTLFATQAYRNAHTAALRTCVLFLCLFVLLACGQKGALYVPKKKTVQDSKPTGIMNSKDVKASREGISRGSRSGINYAANG